MRSFNFKGCTEVVCYQQDRERRQLRSLEEAEAGSGKVVVDHLAGLGMAIVVDHQGGQGMVVVDQQTG